jgi:hypothetical protein
MRRGLTRLGLGALVALGVATDAVRALAGFGVPFGALREAVAPPAPADDRELRGGAPKAGHETGPAEPARGYGQLERAACEAELERRGVPFTVVRDAPGVMVPLRLTGPLHGVTFHSAVPASQRGSSPWEIIDCRLALALDDFAVQLAAHGVVEVVHYSVYRPPPPEWPADKPGTQHVGALAIDAASFTKRDGARLDVERDFHGRIGAHTCGPSAAAPTVATPEAQELRQILCDAAEAKLFNVVLTPNYNRAHFNHFHLEVGPGVKWFFLR